MSEDHWQVIEVTGVGIGELWFDTVDQDLSQQAAEQAAERNERWVAVPMPYDPDDAIPIGHKVDDYDREVVERHV